MLGGVLLGILLFVGFEAAASIGEESHDPHRSIPRALIGTVAASAVFYVLMSYAISVGYGKAAVDQGAWLDPAALDNMATKYIGSLVRGRHRRRRHPRRPGTRAGHLRDARPRLLRPRPRRPAAVGLREDVEPQHAVGRQPGRGRRLRRPDRDLRVGRVDHGRSSCRSSARTRFATFIVSATAGSFAIELVYLILCVAAIRLLLRDGAAWWQWIVIVVAIATPILGFYGALEPAPHNGRQPQLAGVVLGARRWWCWRRCGTG